MQWTQVGIHFLVEEHIFQKLPAIYYLATIKNLNRLRIAYRLIRFQMPFATPTTAVTANYIDDLLGRV